MDIGAEDPVFFQQSSDGPEGFGDACWELNTGDQTWEGAGCVNKFSVDLCSCRLDFASDLS